MKANQRKVFNKLKRALKAGRKKGYIPVSNRIYGYAADSPGYACAYGAMCAGLDIDIRANDLESTVKPMAEALGVEEECVRDIYNPIFAGNDRALFYTYTTSNPSLHFRDRAALKELEIHLENNPEVC